MTRQRIHQEIPSDLHVAFNMTRCCGKFSYVFRRFLLCRCVWQMWLQSDHISEYFFFPNFGHQISYFLYFFISPFYVILRMIAIWSVIKNSTHQSITEWLRPKIIAILARSTFCFSQCWESLRIELEANLSSGRECWNVARSRRF